MAYLIFITLGIIQGNKSFSNGHWDPLALENILFRKKKTFQRELFNKWAASSVTLPNLYNFSKTNKSDLEFDQLLKDRSKL